MGSAAKFGDSLVSVSHKFGASAGSVIGFTKALAPFASAMGINQTSTIGLSTAFSRLGEDGTRSANALNKVMSDLTKSVKTGSPEVRQYASVMNMTTESLTKLVDTDPAEAIVRFTEAINKQGPKAMNTLNQLGFDGIQTFKSLQALGKSSDLRDILQTSREEYGSGSATKGAKEALGGVNDQMTRLGESMQQTIAVAGTPFLDLINKMMAAMNGVAETVNKISNLISGWARSMAPLLAAVNVLKASFQAIAAIQFARFLGNVIKNNTQIGASYALGREAAQTGQTLGPAGNFASRMGERVQNNMSGIMGRPIGETLRGAYAGVKGAVGYGLAGYMNLTSNMLRSDPSEASRNQLATRNFSENFRSLKAGGDTMESRQRAVTDRYNRIAAAEGKAPITQAQDPAKAMGSTKAIIESFKQFGKDLQTAGMSAKSAGAIQMKAGAEVAAAFKGLAMMTVKATVEIAKLGVSALASAIGMTLKQLGMMALVSGVIAAFTSIKGGIDKSNKLYKEALDSDLGATYNDFAEKAGLATTSINMLSKAAQEAAHNLVINNKTMDEANKLTSEELTAAKNPSYKSAKEFGKGRTDRELADAILNLQGGSPDPAARAQLLMDVTSQYGASRAGKVAGLLASNTDSSTIATQENTQDSSDFYSAGLSDYVRNKDSRWWGGRTENDASKGSLVNLRSNLGQNINNVASIYGEKAGNVAQFTEAEKLLKIAASSGNQEKMTAALDAVNEQLGTKLGGTMYDWQSQDLKTALQSNKGQSDDEVAVRKNILSGVQGVDLKNVDYTKLYNTSEKTQDVRDIEDADKAFNKLNKSATGLSDALFEATKISLDNNAFLADISASGKRSDIYNNLTVTQRASVDLANKPNDPVALNTKAISVLNESLKQNKGSTAGAGSQLFNAINAAQTGSVQESALIAAYQMNQQQQNMQNGSLSFLTRATRDVSAGQAAYDAGMPASEAGQTIYQERVDAAQQAQSQELQMVKQFVEARRNLDVQLENQMKDYQKSVLRSNRNFNLQLEYQDADYRKGVRRANEDFKLQRERQSEDFAKSVYSPFQRIAANRTTDASSLVGNLKQQNKVIREQMRNLAKLKKLGLSQQAIDTLDLMNPTNAQEVARLVLDMSSNKSLIESTNKEVKTRNNLATQWENSPMNQASNRSLADFKKNMSRGGEDYETQLERAVKAHKVALSDMAADLKSARLRAFKELMRFGTEVDITADNAKSMLEGAFKGIPEAAKTQMSDALVKLNTIVKNFKPIGISIPTEIAAPTSAAVAKATRATAETNASIAANARITAVEGSTGTAANGNFAWFHNGKWHVYNGQGPQFQEYTNRLLNQNYDPTAIPKAWWTELDASAKIKNLSGKEYKFARGGMVRGPGSEKSDSIEARLSNGEYVVQADAVRKYGKSFLDNVNAQKLAHASYVNGSESKMSSMQGYATSITHNTSTQYDHSTQINGPITVQSTDPNQFMRQMQAKKRLSRLNQPVGN
jgi:hypothetical protein